MMTSRRSDEEFGAELTRRYNAYRQRRRQRRTVLLCTLPMLAAACIVGALWFSRGITVRQGQNHDMAPPASETTAVSGNPTAVTVPGSTVPTLSPEQDENRAGSDASEKMELMHASYVFLPAAATPFSEVPPSYFRLSLTDPDGTVRLCEISTTGFYRLDAGVWQHTFDRSAAELLARLSVECPE